MIQNSWGKGWGSGGYAVLAYEDWFENRQDAWVARPGPELEIPRERQRFLLLVSLAGKVKHAREQQHKAWNSTHRYCHISLIPAIKERFQAVVF